MNLFNCSIFLYICDFVYRCFPHIVNLACQAALEAITDMQHLQSEELVEYEPTGFDKDCIATVRALTNAVIFYSMYALTDIQ